MTPDSGRGSTGGGSVSVGEAAEGTVGVAVGQVEAIESRVKLGNGCVSAAIRTFVG